MTDAQEAAFLRALAENPAYDATRSVYADWLEERGDAARAEFVRAGETPRKHELLEAHGAAWIASLGVAVEDVRYENGALVAVRLPKWDAAVLSPRFLTLQELDLSGTGLTDDDLSVFATCADLPALRKLMLNDNALTDGATASLAAATGLPRMDTVYLFGNAVGAAGRSALEKATGVTLATLDLGEREEGYSMSPGQAEMGRRRQVREEILPVVRKLFDTYPLLKSAALAVAQYWDDEAGDAVHGRLVVSELAEPTLAVWMTFGRRGGDANTPTMRTGSVFWLFEQGIRWADNVGAIPLWAAFSNENGNQSEDFAVSYTTAVLFHRHGGYEFRGMLRPQLDGVRPQYENEA